MALVNYKKMTLNDLILRTQKSDFKAAEELVRRIQKDIFTFFCHLCSTNKSISDLTQETLIKIIKGISRLKDVNSFKSWSKKIAVNVYYDDLRKKKRDENFVIHDEKLFPYIEDSGLKPVECCEGKEIGCKIKSCIIKLSSQARLAIILRELNGFSYEEIAKLTNSNIGTVKSRIFRAREKLQAELADYI